MICLNPSETAGAIDQFKEHSWRPQRDLAQSVRWQSMVFCLVLVLHGSAVLAGTKTWDGRHSIEQIDVRVVYFLPKDRLALADWHDRVSYYCRRIEQFHQREYGGQSTLTTTMEETPFVSELTTRELREGDGDAIFFKTLREVDRKLQFAQDKPEAFPILLVLSDINWRPLEDFYRVRPGADGLEFEGNYSRGQHFPGATSGGARATYLARERKGWGLVSADGWRVPYRGSDCVVYHEGVGHTVGLPHPEPGNGSVMSLGQYRGWISESWLDKEQKIRMQWDPEVETPPDPQLELFSTFRALPEPLVPQPGEAVRLKFDWPEAAQIAACRVRYQTHLDGPWVDAPGNLNGNRSSDDSQPAADSAPPETLLIGSFERPTPVSYRVDVQLTDGSTAEIWGYFQVRNSNREFVQPTQLPLDFVQLGKASAALAVKPVSEEVDLLELLDLDSAWKNGSWQRDADGRLESPKAFGARIELPGDVPQQYRMVVVAEPLDSPNGLLLGSLMQDSRFATLINYTPRETGQSALENVDGQNVGNATTVRRNLLQQGRLSQVVVTVLKDRVVVVVDGETIIDWQGTADRLSLGDYWKTPNPRALFLGAYDCRYRFHRVSLVEVEPAAE